MSNLRSALKSHQSALLQAPCGFGKTIVAAYMGQQATRKNRRVIFAVHRRELARQTALTFRKFGIPAGYIMAGMPADPFALVQIASADTIMRRPELIKCDLFVPDEAHLWGGKTRLEIIAAAKTDGAHIVPLTATPRYGNGDGLGNIADVIVPGPSVADLIARGSLAAYRPIVPSTPDLKGLHTRNGDYITGELEDRFSRPAVYGNAVEAYRKFAMGKRMIGYCYSRKHGAEMAAAFSAAGISSIFIDGETPDAERRRVIEAFADRSIKVLFNCQLFREGLDISAQVGRDVPIEACGIYNPTQSLPLAIQMMMRPMRPQSDAAVILDHAGIFSAHGFPDDEREWSLDGRVKGSKAGEASIPVVVCDGCFAAFRPQACCPECGKPRVVNGREVDSVEAEMVEADIESLRKHREFIGRKIEERECKTREDWVKLAIRRGYKPGWGIFRWEAQQKRAATSSRRSAG